MKTWSKRLEDILSSFLGGSKNGFNDDGQGQFNCPCCAQENGGTPDNKYNLEINLKLGKCHCWKCEETHGTKGNISYIIKRYGTPYIYREYRDEIKYLISSKMYDITLFSDKVSESKEENAIYLPKTFKKINLNNCDNNILLKYLEKRKISQYIIDKFNLGYTSNNEKDFSLRNRLIIPSYDAFGDLNYWVGRDFTGKQPKMKYKNCLSDKNEIIFQESHINWDYDVVLCEGAIDQLYCPNSISLLGKSLTKKTKIYKDIMKKANAKIIICLDADTDINETKRIYSTLNVGRMRNRIWYVRLKNYKDFGEIYEKGQLYGISKTLQRMEQFNELDLLI